MNNYKTEYINLDHQKKQSDEFLKQARKEKLSLSSSDNGSDENQTEDGVTPHIRRGTHRRKAWPVPKKPKKLTNATRQCSVVNKVNLLPPGD